MGEKTFVKITNKEIFLKLCDLEEHMVRMNGKVKLNRWIATTAISLIIAGGIGLMSKFV